MALGALGPEGSRTMGCVHPQSSQERGCSTGRPLARCWCRTWCRGTKVSSQPQTSPFSPKPTQPSCVHHSPRGRNGDTQDREALEAYLCPRCPTPDPVVPPPAPCRTVKKLLLAGLALLGSAIVAAVLVGSVLAMGLAVWRLRRGQRRRRRPRRQCPFQAELQAVVGALVPRELEKQGEPGSEYRSLEHSSV